MRYNCQKIWSWPRRPETILGIREKATFIEVINNPIMYKFFKNLTNHRKKTNRAVVSSHILLPNIRKYWDHRRNLLAVCKTRFLLKQTEKFSLYVWKFSLRPLQNHHRNKIRISCPSQIKVGYYFLNQPFLQQLLIV